jgi:DNA-binding NarL/FixJ family response regulator
MQILIADDHDLVRDGLKPILMKLGPEVSILECANFPDALELANQNSDIDLVVLDLRMPGMDGANGVAVFRQHHPNTRVLIMSGYYRRRDVVDALRHGAVGFIPKMLGSEAMLNAFRLVLAGEKFIPADMLPSDGDQTDMLAADATIDRLTAREHDVLGKLLEGLPNKGIARQLDIQEVTVKLHLRNVYRKLGANNRAHAVKIAIGLGWDG